MNMRQHKRNNARRYVLLRYDYAAGNIVLEAGLWEVFKDFGMKKFKQEWKRATSGRG